MKENNIRQSGDYDAPFCEQQYTCHVFWSQVEYKIVCFIYVLDSCGLDIVEKLLNQKTQVSQSESFTNFDFKTTIACLALTEKLEDLSSLFCLQNWPFHLG